MRLNSLSDHLKEGLRMSLDIHQFIFEIVRAASVRFRGRDPLPADPHKMNRQHRGCCATHIKYFFIAESFLTFSLFPGHSHGQAQSVETDGIKRIMRIKGPGSQGAEYIHNQARHEKE